MNTKAKAKTTMRYNLLDTIPCPTDKDINSSKLPTAKQVLLCFLAHLEDNPSRNAANITAQAVLNIYQKARIPALQLHKIAEEVLKLHDKMLANNKIPKNKRNNTEQEDKINEFKAYLKTTFKAWPRNAYDRIEHAEDRSFFMSMLSDRQACMMGVDQHLSVEEQNVKQKKEDEEKRYRKHKLEMEKLSEKVQFEESEGEESNDAGGASCSGTETPKRKHKRKTYVGTPVVIPHDILQRPAFVAAATRMNITPSEQAVLTELIIKESGGDSSNVATSYATAARARQSTAKVILKDIRESWIPPTAATLHWDGKKMSSLTTNTIKEERLPVLVGNSSEVKLLGVAKYHTGSDVLTGDIISSHTHDLLQSWNCLTNVVSLCFDTTAANTGHLTAACVAIQARLDKALLWCACRHHVGEVLLTHVFDSLNIETSKSPEISIFQRFQKNWINIEPDQFSTIDLSIYDSDQQEFLESCIAEVKATLHSTFSDHQPRDDYLEMGMLSQTFLGEVSQKPTVLKRPGAMHKARWMAKIIYAIKMCLLQEQIELLPKGTIATSHQMKQLKEFVLFITTIYSRWWFLCHSAANAPWYDLCLYKRIIGYKIINPTISAAALKAIEKHLWYLSSELLVFALFGTAVPNSERRALADAMLAAKPQDIPSRPSNRYGTGFGKPVFPTLHEETTLADVVGVDSWWTVNVLDLNVSFLDKDVELWEQNDHFIESKKTVGELNVVNDPAERAVKLTSDFVSAARGEEHFQNILQVVEANRKARPNLRKKQSFS